MSNSTLCNFYSKSMLVLLGVFAMLGLTQAACPSNSGRFQASDAEVTDTRTGLIWQRCSVGQVWDGTGCSRAARTDMTYEEALRYASSNAGLQGWRLPDIKELFSLADKGCQNPAIDSAAFPNTLINLYWSSSPDVGTSNSAWTVYFAYGKVDAQNRNNSFAARLVRASQ